HRRDEKQFLRSLDLPTVAWAPVDTDDDLQEAVATVGTPAILKTAGYGYDGKGQVAVDAPGDAGEAWRTLGRGAAVLEARATLAAEASVVVARDLHGEVRTWPPIRNVHQRGILDHSVVPADLPGDLAERATTLAGRVAPALELVGVACVEFFVDDAGRLLVNEIAPRPHNSGHLTIEASATSQFEQQVRTVTGLPLGETDLPRPAAMANLLGDLWQRGEPDWAAALSVPGVALHLYGKAEARPGRKMGHLTAVADGSDLGADAALQRVLRARDALAGDA
ncbi:MAG: ATP-grasp domain-containing protein, partial [Trueperaceae bacterium]